MHRQKLIKTYALFVNGQRNTRSIRSTNKDRSSQRKIIIVIVVYLDSISGPARHRFIHCSSIFGQHMHDEVGLQLHTASSTNSTFKFKRICSNNTNVRAICLGPTRHPFHAFNKRRLTQSHHCHCNAFGQAAK